jgi:hypothetical protein
MTTLMQINSSVAMNSTLSILSLRATQPLSTPDKELRHIHRNV